MQDAGRVETEREDVDLLVPQGLAQPRQRPGGVGRRGGRLLFLLSSLGGAQPLDDGGAGAGGYEELIGSLEAAMLAGDPDAYLALMSPAVRR